MNFKEFKFLRLDGQTYKFNRWVFRFVFLLMIAYFIFLGFRFGFQKEHIYYSCLNVPSCENPFFNEFGFSGVLPSEMIISRYLPYGYSYGSKPGFFYTHFGDIFVFLMLGGFIINHLLYNKGFSFKKLVVSLDINKRGLLK